MSFAYRFVSTDDHIIEPRDVWTGRLESRLQDAAPRLVEKEKLEHWVFEDQRAPNSGLSVMAGRRREEYSPKAVRYADMRPGCYDPRARLADMDADGIEAEVCFPTVPGMAGSLFIAAKDKELALRCLQAYNDWLADTWCAADPRRLVGQVILPLWDVSIAVDELERGVGRGLRALSFPNDPESLGLPGLADPHWDPLWTAVEAAGLPVTLHIASGAMRGALPLDPGAGAPAEVFITIAPTTNFVVLSTLLFSGVLARHPGLRFLSVEGGIGWIPYLLQRADETFHKHRHWTKPRIAEPPSFYFRRQLFANFLDDPVGIACRHAIGVDNVMFETDYPHSDTTFPHSHEVVARAFAGVPPDEARRMLRGNAIRLFGLDTAVTAAEEAPCQRTT